MEQIATALFLALVVNRIIEYAASPLRKKYPYHDFWYLIYVSWVLGAILSYAGNLNLFTEQFATPQVGLVLTAVVVGGGANLIRDIFVSLKQ